MPAPTIAELLDDERYHIEFDDFLTNHSKHAVLALAGLGAPREQIVVYYEDYAAQTYGHGLEPARAARRRLSEADWESLLGRREDYGALLEFFTERAGALGREELLRRYLPRLVEGCAGALLHGCIHLGWGLGSGSRRMMVEGLAYQSFCWLSVRPQRGARPVGGDEAREVWGSLLRVAAAFEGAELPAWREQLEADPTLSPDQGFAPELAGTGTQLRIARVLARGHALVDATPGWIDAIAEPDHEALWAQLHEAVALLYQCAGGDFVLLHLITGLHALEQICAQLEPEPRRAALLCFWRAIVAVLLARGRMPTVAQLEATREAQGAVRDSDEAAWAPLVARGLAEVEEHNIKLVHVLRSQWRRHGQRALFRHAAEHFIVTPKVRTGTQSG